MRVVFMGSPSFAVPSLQRLAAHCEVVAVVAQPDRPAGRGRQLTAPPVKTVALELGLPVAQPSAVRGPAFASWLQEQRADVGIVVAYGRILTKAALSAFPHGCINVHASLLPAWRGAAPVQWAVISEAVETGVSIMQLDEGLDTGPVYAARTTAIGIHETSGDLMARLADLGADLLLASLSDILAGRIHAVAQDDARASLAPPLTKGHGGIDFGRSASAVGALIRGVDPWPGAYASLRGGTLKLAGARLVDERERVGEAGQVVAIDGNGMVIACGRGAVAVSQLQLPGKKWLAPAQAAAGRLITVGERLEAPSDAVFRA